jgi:hypothetical protein
VHPNNLVVSKGAKSTRGERTTSGAATRGVKAVLSSCGLLWVLQRGGRQEGRRDHPRIR